MQNISLSCMMNWHHLLRKKKFNIDIFNFEFNKIEELENSSERVSERFIYYG